MKQGYVSEELTHFAGRHEPCDEDRFVLLQRILRTGELRPRGQHMIVDYRIPLSSNEAYLSNVVCFCDIPASDFGIHVSKYGSFGLSFRKPFMVAWGANPVYYISSDSKEYFLPRGDPYAMVSHRTPRSGSTKGQIPLSRFFDVTFQNLEAAERLGDLARSIPTRHLQVQLLTLQGYRFFKLQLAMHHRILSFMKFFDPYLSEDHQDNFYMEREWRVRGPVRFRLRDVARIILPTGYADRLREAFPSFRGAVTELPPVGPGKRKRPRNRRAATFKGARDVSGLVSAGYLQRKYSRRSYLPSVRVRTGRMRSP
ncbi:MAG TPA: abortive infection system antitoxin AbiGi family protein [Thermoplasmata archaeon]|nr:abortive infection system antitoxin AbiGi family protein [Thermoplasmata archaeon]